MHRRQEARGDSMDGLAEPSIDAFEKPQKTLGLRNNSMVELYNECLSKIAKPKTSLRNSMNGGMWETTVDTKPQTYDNREKRHVVRGSMQLLNKKDSMRAVNHVPEN